MTNPTPRSITAVRFIGTGQALVAFSLGGFAAVLTLAAFVSDRADAAAGDPNEFAGLAEYIGILAAGALVGAALLVGVPTLLLRRDRPMARIALVVGELVTAVPIAIVLPFGLGADGRLMWVVLGVAYVALAGLAAGLLLAQPAQEWCGERRIAVAPF